MLKLVPGGGTMISAGLFVIRLASDQEEPDLLAIEVAVKEIGVLLAIGLDTIRVGAGTKTLPGSHARVPIILIEGRLFFKAMGDEGRPTCVSGHEILADLVGNLLVRFPIRCRGFCVEIEYDYRIAYYKIEEVKEVATT